MKYLLTILLAFSFVIINAEIARSEFKQPTAISRMFPPELTKSITVSGSLSAYQFNTYREPTVAIYPKKLELNMVYNGIDDENWPYTRILATLLNNVCQIKDTNFSTNLIEQTYRSRSLTPAVNLGGNAGTSVSKRQSATRNGCLVSVEVKGARWHTITTTIAPARK
ncbi:hypothetical protein IQ264_16230 [Phormidium sp. LEGE 05292]|uniref:hypothetical protein n=1 Tax=[Phormidium] sp. LEGE 05292 TaxID=767427 RepID=UPI001880C6FC|nr:hypothetical protein [Phormidium sp. LEGE 05292]MBE9226977.1 hypothetical protein [Phormidium sp. LEGE 05292]